MFIRRNVGGLGSDWADPILWYARGVADMKSRALDDPTSWRFYAAMHGIYEPFWQHYGYLRPTDTMPGQPLVDRFWNQCQHGSWYFLPWHRGYLLAFEAVVRDAVLKAGGPSDWALPYWNYFKSGQSRLPPAFNSPNWPDGQNDNPLFVEPRWGPNNDGNVFVPLSQVNLNALADPDFTGGSSGGSPGFGGVDTGFEHGGQVHGRIESQPHDWVHSLIGGSDPNDPNMPGLMSDPDVAGLDPIFWLHHANIDRLWSVWRNNPASHADPTQSNWTAGPASIGERAFSMPMPDGTRWDYTPKDVEDTRTLGYEYDDISPPAGVPAPHDRLIGLGIAPAAAAQAAKGAVPMADHRQVELIGANTAPLKIGGNGAQTTLKLAPEPKTKMLNSLAAAPRTAAPDRIFLNLENVRGTADATALHVYVDIPDGAAPTDHPDHLAGSISLFGVRKASSPDGDHAGKGLTFVLDISSIIDAMHLQRRLDPNSLKISIVPVKPIADQTQVSVGRVSVYRQGQ